MPEETPASRSCMRRPCIAHSPAARRSVELDSPVLLHRTWKAFKLGRSCPMDSDPWVCFTPPLPPPPSRQNAGPGPRALGTAPSESATRPARPESAGRDPGQSEARSESGGFGSESFDPIRVCPGPSGSDSESAAISVHARHAVTP
jgi:hypothetical protein